MTIAAAIEALGSGWLVVIPTDTVYGLAAALDSVRTIFDVKRRDPDKAIPVLGASLDQLAGVASFDDRARRLAERFWPGPLTIVVPRRPGRRLDLGGGDEATIAVRVPARAVTAEILRAVGPLAVTSANISGQPPATTIDQARAGLGDAVAVYVDDGDCSGDPSTIVAVGGSVEVLRLGPISAAAVEAALGGSGDRHTG